MNNSNTFINWLEGFLDACKNKPSSSQIREIRKKIAYHNLSSPKITLITDSPFYKEPIISVAPNNTLLNEEQKALVEKSRSATTMEELEEN